jgi:DNA modification methylase
LAELLGCSEQTVERSKLTKQEWIDWGSRGVWTIPSVRANDDHEAKFPLELPRRVIQLLTEANDIVLDCFIGSGTTAIAAIQAGRRYIGIDKEAKYVEMARKACEAASCSPQSTGASNAEQLTLGTATK